MAKVFRGEETFMTRFLQPVERFIYLLIGTDENKEMNWKQYAYALVIFNIISNFICFYITIITGDAST